MSVVATDEEFVFNIVWTGTVFPYLRYFVESQMAHSGARFRFLANGCPPEQITLLEEFRERHPDRVVEVLVVTMGLEAHGVALDAALEQRDDGEFFCFIDPDILAQGPFVHDFAQRLAEGCCGVTSGRGVWCDDDVLPPDQKGVSGEYFYAPDGYLFGSPHFAMYQRRPLEATLARWGIGFKSAGARRLTDEGRARLDAIGKRYWLYDTGKLVNIFLQEDGNRLCHFEHDNLMHIGGLSHYLAPTATVESEDGGEPEPDWSRFEGLESRYEVARFTATVLRDLSLHLPPPPIPAGLESSMVDRLARVRNALITLVRTYE